MASSGHVDARSLAMKKSAPRMGSVSSATWNTCMNEQPFPTRIEMFHFPHALMRETLTPHGGHPRVGPFVSG